MNLDVAVSLPHEAETVGLIRGIVADALVNLGVTPTCTEEIRLALSEACTNVVEHAASGDEYEVRLQVDERQCEISVINAGGAFDTDALAEAMPSRSSTRGRGVAIMRAVMDQVSVVSEPSAGTVAHLVKKLELQPSSPLRRLSMS